MSIAATFTRRDILGSGLALTASSAALARAPSPSVALSFTVDVPIDHDHVAGGSFPLRCEWGAPPRKGKPTILLIADGQQFFLRPGGAARIQNQLFGSAFNVLGILGRSRSDRLSRLIMSKGGVDWNQAYRLLSWTQWVGDIARVVDHLHLGPMVGLYGRSGGAHLIHQYLTVHPHTQARVLVQAAVNHPLDVRWGLDADYFWQDFSAREPGVAKSLVDWLQHNPKGRRDLVLVLQRQNFFETLEDLPGARLKAVQAFLGGDEAVISQLHSRYQIDAIEQLNSTLEGIASTVRVYEFSAPHQDPRRAAPPPLRPSTESLFYYAEPLSNLELRPVVPKTDWDHLRFQSAEVLQVAGRYDHTCDYRAQIGLNGLTRGSHLLILDDNHVFERWSSSGRQLALIQAWFDGGWNSAALQNEVSRLGDLRWRETSTRDG